jgi:hypothetical protein
MNELSVFAVFRRIWSSAVDRLLGRRRRSLEELMGRPDPPSEDDRGEVLGSGVPRRPPGSSGSATAAVGEPGGASDITDR